MDPPPIPTTSIHAGSAAASEARVAGSSSSSSAMRVRHSSMNVSSPKRILTSS